MLGDLTRFNIHPCEYMQSDIEDYLSGDPNTDDDYCQTLLHNYVLSPDFDVEVMQKIINNGANLESRNLYGKTAFLIAVLIREKKAMEVLIENGADVNVKDKFENNALHYISLPELNYHFEMVDEFNFDDTYSILERLLKEGVDVNARNYYKRDTPLMWASRGKHVEIVKKLLAFGANVHLVNHPQVTSLHFAVYYKESDILSVWKREENCHAILSELVRNGACVNCFDMAFWSPLYYTVDPEIPNNINFAKELIRNATLVNWYWKMEFYTEHNRVLGYRGENLDLVRYADLHYEEVKEMRKHILPGKSMEEKNAMEKKMMPYDGSNLCEFAYKGVSEDELRKTPEIKEEVLKILLKKSVPLYQDIISSQLGRQFLLEKGKILSVFTMGETEVVYLNSYVISEICSFLEERDILSLLSTFPDQLTNVCIKGKGTF